MGLSGSREANAASGGDAAYHAYGRAAASSSSSATRVSRDDVPPSSMPATDGNASDDERLVPSLFTWTFGGQNVSVTGAWDGWRQKTPMERNGTEWSVVIFIPSGEYHFKYVVDGNWQCNPALQQQTDENGNTNNFVQVVATTPDFDTTEPATRSDPPSPLSSYDNSRRTEFSGEVPVLPAHIRPYVTHAENAHRPDPDRARSCVRYEHLFVNETDDKVRTISLMDRHKEKTIVTVFVTNSESATPGPVNNNTAPHA